MVVAKKVRPHYSGQHTHLCLFLSENPPRRLDPLLRVGDGGDELAFHALFLFFLYSGNSQSIGETAGCCSLTFGGFPGTDYAPLSFLALFRVR